MQEVYTYSIDLTIEQLRIAHFLADGINTYTPRGHWKSIAATHFVQQHCSEARLARNIALLNMSLIDAAVVCWDAKSIYITPRPSQINPDIKTVTGIPNFPAYISISGDCPLPLTLAWVAGTRLSSITPAKFRRRDIIDVYRSLRLCRMVEDKPSPDLGSYYLTSTLARCLKSPSDTRSRVKPFRMRATQSRPTF